MKIDIFSDIEFNNYQHINQFLFYELEKRNTVRFFYKIFLNSPSLKRVGNLFKNSGKRDCSEKYTEGVCRLHNLPPLLSIFIKAGGRLIKRQLNNFGDTVVTFVPNKSLESIYGNYRQVVYYCVHDLKQYGFSKKILEHEKELVEKSKFIFCDNSTVLKRLAGSSECFNILENDPDVLKQCRFIEVPAPVPDCFFSRIESEVVYDFIYFGSIDRKFDWEVIDRLSRNGFKILIKSDGNRKLKTENIFYEDPVFDLHLLVEAVFTAKFILLPYVNDEFVETVTPGKIYQSIVTELPVFSSNNRMIEEYSLVDINLYLKSNGEMRNNLVKEYYEKKNFSDYAEYSTGSIIGKIEKILKG